MVHVCPGLHKNLFFLLIWWFACAPSICLHRPELHQCCPPQHSFSSFNPTIFHCTETALPSPHSRIESETSRRRRRRRRRRVKLGLCASLLAPSSTTNWVSWIEEMAKARAQNNLILRLPQSEVPLYCHMMPFAENGIILHCLTLIKQSSFVATLIHLKT